MDCSGDRIGQCIRLVHAVIGGFGNCQHIRIGQIICGIGEDEIVGRVVVVPVCVYVEALWAGARNID